MTILVSVFKIENDASIVSLRNMKIHIVKYAKKWKFCADSLAKGQLISKFPFGVIVWTKIPTNKFDNFCPRIKKVVKLTK